VPQYRKSLDQLDKVVVEYGPPAADPTAIAPRALLLGGWLASRLGWKIIPGSAARKNEATSIKFENRGREITIEFAPAEREAIEAGRLGRVTLGSADSANFEVKRSDDGSRIETEVRPR
jgi:glucose-6-phosphate dehydrogenase assembly protein OpcA